jgi:hypothetical protein
VGHLKIARCDLDGDIIGGGAAHTYKLTLRGGAICNPAGAGYHSSTGIFILYVASSGSQSLPELREEDTLKQKDSATARI